MCGEVQVARVVHHHWTSLQLTPLPQLLRPPHWAYAEMVVGHRRLEAAWHEKHIIVTGRTGFQNNNCDRKVVIKAQEGTVALVTLKVGFVVM